MNFDHIRPLGVLPHHRPQYPEHCGEVSCDSSAVTCKSEHDDRDCPVVYGCKPKFDCANDHDCGNAFKCRDYEIA